MVLASLRSRLSYYDRRRAARLVPRRALPANATDMNASPNPWALPPHSRRPRGWRIHGPAAHATGRPECDQFV